MPIEKGSLVLVDYTAKVKDTNEVFETTREEEAKKTDLYDPTRKYEPRLITIGEGLVLKGLEEALGNASVGEKLDVEIPPEKGFGPRDNGKVRMIPQRKLGDKADEVQVGDTVEMEDRKGIVRYIGSGRIQVDFNHRFAGKTLLYNVNIVKKLETDDEKINGLVKKWLPLDDAKVKFALKGSEVEVEVPEELVQMDGLQVAKSLISRDVFKALSAVKNVKFVENYAAPKAEEKKEDKPAAEAKAEAAATTTKQA
jgi:peptidylprolyl isomerase